MERKTPDSPVYSDAHFLWGCFDAAGFIDPVFSSGVFLYRNPKTTVIGDVFVRFSKAGDFELTFSKGPGVNLLLLKQDTGFAEVTGPMAGRGWSGPVERAPNNCEAGSGFAIK